VWRGFGPIHEPPQGGFDGPAQFSPCSASLLAIAGLIRAARGTSHPDEERETPERRQYLAAARQWPRSEVNAALPAGRSKPSARHSSICSAPQNVTAFLVWQPSRDRPDLRRPSLPPRAPVLATSAYCPTRSSHPMIVRTCRRPKSAREVVRRMPERRAAGFSICRPTPLRIPQTWTRPQGLGLRSTSRVPFAFSGWVCLTDVNTTGRAVSCFARKAPPAGSDRTGQGRAYQGNGSPYRKRRRPPA
jgi:hypothetical protein